MIHFGAPIHDAPRDPAALARLHRESRYTAAYVPSWFTSTDAAAIHAFRKAFADAKVLLAEVGAWCNLADANPRERQKNLCFVQSRLALAEELGARCCVDYLGTLSPTSTFGPDPRNFSQEGFDFAVETVRAVIDAVNPQRTRFALEFMSWCLPDSVDSALRLIAAVDRPAFAIHLDPVNLIQSPRQYIHNADVIRDAFARLGPHIVSCHAKDIIARQDLTLHLDETAPGRGVLDYAVFLTEAARLHRPIPILLEHLASNDEYQNAHRHLHALARCLDLPVAS